MHAVVETEGDLADAEAGLSEAERWEVVGYLAMNPEAGTLIVGTGGARKLRFGVAGRGKSGGVRIITYYAGVELPVFLLTVYAKNEASDLSAAGRQAIKRELAGLAIDYRRNRLRRIGRERR